MGGMTIRSFAVTILASFAVFSAVSSPAAAKPALSASDILARCGKAYDALNSYTCHTDVIAKSGASSYHTTADISFLRPAYIRAEGLNMTGELYAYVSNGASTQQMALGAWQPTKSAEIAIGGATGIAQGAATTVPALLLHTMWGYPFSPAQTVNPHVAGRSISGHQCYYILTSGVLNQAFWVDKKTFLLDQVAANLSMGKMHLRQVQTISKQQINPHLPTSTFKLH